MELQLANRVAIVTGGAGGIGAATAQALGAAGASLVVTDILDEQGLQLCRQLQVHGYGAHYKHLDVSNQDNWESVVEETVSTLGGVHVLVNNAGVGSSGDVESETRDGWDRVVAINQTGAWLGIRTVAPVMRASGGGSIVNVSSVMGVVGGFGEWVAYHATKGALLAVTKNAAIRYAREGIRVNSIHPGFIDTPMSDFRGNPLGQLAIANTPMGRFGTPAEVASVIAFLASDAASFMTGSEVYVDGGWTAR